MKLIIATHNEHKVKEFERILAPFGIEAISQTRAGISVEAEETADTFEGNSFLKAKAVYQECHLPVIADDSGLEVDALHGAPGVYSARYGGPGLTDAERVQKLLAELEGVEPQNRAARFVCCITLITQDGRRYTFTGTCEGQIGFEPRGVNGFGYDPVFYVGEDSMSELAPSQKDAISHRGKALRQLSEALPEILKGEIGTC